jgi:hypothetical protein
LETILTEEQIKVIKEIEEINKFYADYLKNDDARFIHVEGEFGVGKTTFLMGKIFKKQHLTGIRIDNDLLKMYNENMNDNDKVIHIELWNDMYTAEPIEFIVRKFLKNESIYFNILISMIAVYFFVEFFSKLFTDPIVIGNTTYYILFALFWLIFLSLVYRFLRVNDFRANIYLVISKIKFIEFNSSHELFANCIVDKLESGEIKYVVVEDIDRINNSALVATIQFLNLINEKLNKRKTNHNVKFILSYSDAKIFERNNIKKSEEFPTSISEELFKLNFKNYKLKKDNFELIVNFLKEKKFPEYEIKEVQKLHYILVEKQLPKYFISYRNFENIFINIFNKYNFGMYSIVDVFVEFVSRLLFEVSTVDIHEMLKKDEIKNFFRDIMKPNAGIIEYDSTNKKYYIAEKSKHIFGNLIYSLDTDSENTNNIYEMMLKREIYLIKPYFFDFIEEFKFQVKGENDISTDIFVKNVSCVSVEDIEIKIIVNNKSFIYNLSQKNHESNSIQFYKDLLNAYFLIKSGLKNEIDFLDSFQKKIEANQFYDKFRTFEKNFIRIKDNYLEFARIFSNLNYYTEEVANFGRLDMFEMEKNIFLVFDTNMHFNWFTLDEKLGAKVLMNEGEFEKHAGKYNNRLDTINKLLIFLIDCRNNNECNFILSEIIIIHQALANIENLSTIEFEQWTKFKELFEQLDSFCNEVSSIRYDKHLDSLIKNA